ncbi:MAG: glycosyltransferase family 87 protein [Candidatus Entotheonellia bacterium]
MGTVIGITVPAGLGWDFANFYDTGKRVAAGQVGDIYNPDSLIAGDSPQGKLSFWGAPVSALFYVPLSLFPPTSALILFKIQNTLAYFIALILLYMHNLQFSDDSSFETWQFAAMFAFLTLIYQPFWTIYRVGGQTTPTVFLLFVLALLSHTYGLFFFSSILLILASMIKPTFLLTILCLLFISKPPFIWKTIVVLISAILLSVIILGWNIHQQFLEVLLQGMKKPFPWFYNSSLYVIAENYKFLPHSKEVSELSKSILTFLPLGIKIMVSVMFAYIIRISRGEKWSPRARNQFDFLIAVLFCLLISQTVWEHYLALLFPFLIYIAASQRHFSYGARALLVAIFIVSIGQNLIFVNFLRTHFTFDTTVELFAIGLFKSGPLLLTLILLWRYRRELFQSYRAHAWSHQAM